jgi:hypothetical protein
VPKIIAINSSAEFDEPRLAVFFLGAMGVVVFVVVVVVVLVVVVVDVVVLIGGLVIVGPLHKS